MGAKVLIFMDFFQGKNSVGKQKSRVYGRDKYGKF